MDTIIGKGRISANSVIVYKSLLTKTIGKKYISLSFTDNDALPFGRFPIFNLNHEITYRFYIGKIGTTHGSLLQQANEDNQKILGTDWMHNSKYSKFVSEFSIKSAGRIWKDRKILVMRDILPSIDIVKYAISQLNIRGFDVYSYNMLYNDPNGNVHICGVQDYINGCSSEYGYNTEEDFYFLSHNNGSSEKQHDGRYVTKAEIDFYKRYGLGDSVEPRHAILTESQLKSVVKRVVVKILNEIRHKR